MALNLFVKARSFLLLGLTRNLASISLPSCSNDEVLCFNSNFFSANSRRWIGTGLVRKSLMRSIGSENIPIPPNASINHQPKNDNKNNNKDKNKEQEQQEQQ